MKAIVTIIMIGMAIYGLLHLVAWAVIVKDVCSDHKSRNTRNKKKENEDNRKLNDAKIAYAAACDYYNELVEENKSRATTGMEMNQINEIAIENARIAMMNAQMAYEDMMRTMQIGINAAEEARLAATGIEFGGYNPDPNLNPGMSFAMEETRSLCDSTSWADSSFDSDPGWNNSFDSDPGWSNSFDSGWDSFSNDSFGGWDSGSSGWDNSFNAFF